MTMQTFNTIAVYRCSLVSSGLPRSHQVGLQCALRLLNDGCAYLVFGREVEVRVFGLDAAMAEGAHRIRARHAEMRGRIEHGERRSGGHQRPRLR